MSTLTAVQAERLEWRDRRGDDWSRIYTRTTGTRVYNLASLVVQIRQGQDETAPLVASTANGAGYDSTLHALITTTGSDFTSDPIVFAWQIAHALTLRIRASDSYMIEAQCLIDGALKTFLRHRWGVDHQTAVAA